MSLNWNRNHSWKLIPYDSHNYEADRYKCRFCGTKASANELPDTKCLPTYAELVVEIRRLEKRLEKK